MSEQPREVFNGLAFHNEIESFSKKLYKRFILINAWTPTNHEMEAIRIPHYIAINRVSRKMVGIDFTSCNAEFVSIAISIIPKYVTSMIEDPFDLQFHEHVGVDIEVELLSRHIEQLMRFSMVKGFSVKSAMPVYIVSMIKPYNFYLIIANKIVKVSPIA